MNYEDYKRTEKEIKKRCRMKFGLILGGLAGLLLGGKFFLKNFDIDINEYPWQLPAYGIIGFVATYYARKEPERLNILDRIYEERKNSGKR